MIYRIYNTETKLYSKGGTYYTKFNQVGKIWNHLSYVKSHLRGAYCERISNIKYWLDSYNKGIPKDEYGKQYYTGWLTDKIKSLTNFNIDKITNQKYYNNIPKELEVIEYDDNLVELRRFNARELYPEYI